MPVLHHPFKFPSAFVMSLQSNYLIWIVFLFFFSLTVIPETFPSLIRILYELYFWPCCAACRILVP